jgi:DNA processing protein
MLSSPHKEAVMDERAALLGLVRVDGLGSLRIHKLIRHFGSAQTALFAPYRELLRTGLAANIAASITQIAHQDHEALLQRFVERGIQVLAHDDAQYPPLLTPIPNPPILLFVRGSVSALATPSVALVGTRRPSSYGIDITRRIAHDLALQGITIVSGLAMGIDTVAHESALHAHGHTIAVLPSGVDLIYPERNRTLAERMLAQPGNALVSEFFPGTKATPLLFPARNRLISGLAHGVVVCEAGAQSGALITVKAALDQGREVMAVPGSVFAVQSAGCLDLLRQGATPVRHARDICESLAFMTAVATAVTHDPLLQLLDTPRHIDELCRMLEQSSATLLGDLLMREIRGEVRDLGNGFYARC